MDFIKTSSLRALIELTFQRNWNGLIWMSRKGVIAKRVKTAPDGHIENQRPTAQSGWPRNMFRARPNVSVRLKSRPKSKPLGRSRITTRETKPAVGQPQRHATPRTTKPREPGSNASRPRNSSRVPRTNAPSDPGKLRPRPAETIGQISSVRPAGRP
ncbi:unnamed protein product [Microthlaspi erraticum]|uniref:Uncharacterized protein n=1 Tax=Microthlaspi erraticum TaxID=1685480 RepID=A0A6D2KAQ0_9BRAS|nr:unnamed protein product [Microthlaspi erraticum]